MIVWFLGLQNIVFEPDVCTIKIRLRRECQNSTSDLFRSYYNSNVSINGCLFSRTVLFSGDGGIIYISNKVLLISIINTVFYECFSSNNGGAIYSDSMNSSLKNICANRCSAKTYQFAFLWEFNTNIVQFLSMAFCSNDSIGDYSTRFDGGNQIIENTNSSMNNIKQISGIGTLNPLSFACSYCHFSNNQVSSIVCVYFYGKSGTMHHSNVIHNNSPSWGVVSVNNLGSYSMEYCILCNNKNVLFCVRTTSLQIMDCYISHETSLLSTSKSVSTINISFTLTEIFNLQFFKSHSCNADNPIQNSTPYISITNMVKNPTQYHKWFLTHVLLIPIIF